MWLSMFSVWSGLLTLVAPQSCPDPSENSASWVRLKPLGQCKDGESTCPYRITLPPLTIQLPKHFRELEKMAEELQSLTEMVNQLKADCCECKDRQGKDWNIRTDNEGEDEEKIQASKGTLNIRQRQQDMVRRESTVQATTSRSGMEDIMIISSDAKDINSTALGKQRHTNQERNINPRTTKPRPEINGGQKGSNPVRKNLISGSMSKADEVPSLTTTKKNTPQAKLTESSFSGDPDNEPPTHHEKHKDNPIKVIHEMNPSETLTAKGKVKSVPEYHVVTMDTEDDVDTKQLQTTKGDKVQDERRLVTGNNAQNNRELETSMKQLTRKTHTKEDNKEFTDAEVKESRSNIFDDSVSVIQQPTLKHMEKNNRGANSTKPKQFKPGVYSGGDAKVNSRPVNTDDTTRRQRKVMSPITGRANASDNISQMDQQIVGINSKNAFIPDMDATMDTGTESKFITAKKVSEEAKSLSPANNVHTVSERKHSRPPNSGGANSTADLINRSTLNSNVQISKKTGKDAESNTGMDAHRVSGLQNSGLPISGMNDGKSDVSPTNSQIPNIKYDFKAGTDSEIDAGIDLKPVNIIETVSEIKNSTSPISDSANVTADVDFISAKRKSSNSQTTLKSSKDAESHIGMNSNPVNVLNNSRSPVSGMIDGMVGERLTNPQVGHRKTHSKTSTKSGSDARVGKSNPINNVETVSGQGTSRSHISKEGLKNSRASIPDRANSTAEIDLKPPKSLNPQMPFTHDADVHSKSGMDENQFNASKTVSHIQMSKSPKSDITDTVAVSQTYPGSLDDTFTNPFKAVTDKERSAEMDLNPLSKVEMLEMPQSSITDKADATVVNVNQINPQTTYSNSKNVTVMSTSDNKVETVSGLEKPRFPISVTEKKTGIYPNRNQTTDIESKETSNPPISDSRIEVSGTNPTLNGNNGLPRRQFLPRSKLNMTQPRNGWVKSTKPMSTDTERKTAQTNNKTTSSRSDAMTSGRRLPTGLLPKRQEKQREITHQPERISPTGISPSKDYIQRRLNILQRIPVNESKSFSSGGSKNTSGVVDYTISSGTTHFNSKTASSPNNKFNSTAYDMSQSVSPTLATQDNVDRADTKGTKTAPTVNVLRTLINHHIEGTSQSIGNKPKVKNISVSSREDLVLDTVGKIGRDTPPRIVEEIKGTERRPGQTMFKTSSEDSNQQKHNKPLRAGSIQNLGEKMPLVVESSGRHELDSPTTLATTFTVKPQIKDNHSKGSQFTPPIKTAPHFVDQDPVEQAKTTSGVKVSNKHIHPSLENPRQEMEPKRSHSDPGNKEFHSASSDQGSRVGLVTDFQHNSLDPIQNRTTNSTPIVIDIVQDSTGSKVSTIFTESINKNKAKDSNPVAMDKLEASTEANQVTQFLDNAKHYGNNKSSLGSTDPVEGNNEGHSIDNNNGNHNPVSVKIRTGATSHKIAAGHPNNGGNKKPLSVNNMDERQGLEKQLLSNCHGQCDLRPASQSILNNHETSNNDRDKPSQDCSDFMRRNLRSGIYNITPARSGNRTFPVFCNMKSSGGGWTLIQRRFDGSISFNRTWNDYKQGFGKLMGEFWLGNDKIHWLTSTKTMVLRIELEDLDGNKDYAQYDHFHVANESQYYKLTIEGYSGTAGDAMQYSKHFNHNQKNFTTPDRDNDQYTSGNCGAYYGSGWWFDACLSANLNGKYYETKYRGVRNGIFWGTWHNISNEYYLTHDRQSFKTVRMMIRPRTGFLMN